MIIFRNGSQRSKSSQNIYGSSGSIMNYQKTINTLKYRVNYIWYYDNENDNDNNNDYNHDNNNNNNHDNDNNNHDNDNNSNNNNNSNNDDNRIDKYRDKIRSKIQICTNLSLKTYDFFFVSTSASSNKNPCTFGTDEVVSDSKTWEYSE